MSSKNSANKKCASKSLDTSLNRKRTQKMQLRKMDRSMKAITQLLKSPNTSHLQAPPKKLPEKSSDVVHLQLSQKNLPEKKTKPADLQVSPKRVQEKSVNASQLQYVSKRTSVNNTNRSLGKIILKKSPDKSSNTGHVVQFSSKRTKEKSFVTSPKNIIQKNVITHQLQVSRRKVSGQDLNRIQQNVALKRLDKRFAKMVHIKSEIPEKESTLTQLTSKKVLKKKTVKTDKLSVTGSDKKSTQNENNEYYPNKLKRNVTAKTILMKSNYNMKVVGATNKRKLRTPKKEIKSSLTEESSKAITEQITLDSPIQSSKYLGPDISEVIRLIEDTHSLNDEDFLEILTCPSPVWWEDPPDERYLEDPIFTRRTTSNKKQTIDTLKSQKDIKANAIDEKSCRDNIKIEIKNTDTKFIEKRTKLENILGTIKNRTGHTGLQKKIRNNQIKTKKKIDSKSRIKRNSDSTEGSIFSDISLSEDELLRDLENLDIPINNELNKIDDDYKIDNIFETDETYKDKDENVEDMKPNLKILHNLLTLEVPTKLPPLKRYPKKMVVRNYSPKSNKSSDDISNSELDTISDTNIYFIDDDECSVNNDTKNSDQVKYESNEMGNHDKQVFLADDNKKLVTVSKDTECMNDFEDLMDKSEFITVFKIKSHNFVDIMKGNKADKSKNNHKIKLESRKRRNNGKLNTFFKKRKKSQTSSKVINSSEPENKATKVSDNSNAIQKCELCNMDGKIYVDIPDSTKKLCLYCSSIFDDVCTYCDKIKGAERKICFCKCEGVKESYKYKCNYCSFGVNAKKIMRVHLFSKHECEVRLNGSLSNSYTYYMEHKNVDS